MIEWIPIADWEIKAGEEFLAIVESDIAPRRTVCSAIYRKGELYVAGYSLAFSDSPKWAYLGDMGYGARRITYAAKPNYPKSLYDKILEHSFLRAGPYDREMYCKEIVEIVEIFYGSKK